MSTTSVLLVLLAFVLGCAVGAFLVLRSLRPRIEELRAELDDATARLGRTTTDLAAAAAQRDLLQQHNRELTGKTSTDNDVLRALVPSGVEGAIVGKALYAQAFTLGEALEVAGRP